MPLLTWSTDTALLGITLALKPHADFHAPSHFTTELHSWFLSQVRLTDPDLSAYLHNGQSEKAFTVSGILTAAQSRTLQFSATQSYQWTLTALSKRLCQWFQQWLRDPPQEMNLRSGILHIQQWQITLPATTYETIWEDFEVETMNADAKNQKTLRVQSSDLTLSFLSATSFRKRRNHMPLPIPENVFHSYLRRWNNFAHLEFEQDEFLEWINDCIVILRHDIHSQKVQAGKQGSVTGFVGSVQFGFTTAAKAEPEYVQLVQALIACAPYFGTGHKVTFGLGQTQHGWHIEPISLSQAPPLQHSEPISLNDRKAQLIQDRHAELKAFFFNRKKRQGGERANKAADLWATILARQEFGESLKAISQDLDISYDTLKRYAKRAHHELENSGTSHLLRQS